MYKVIHESGAPIKAWIEGVPLEDAARQQLINVASLPFIHHHVAVMPDVHWGMGATVGSVIPTKGAIMPAAVGVDIGCGMVAARTSLSANDLPDNLSRHPFRDREGRAARSDQPRWRGRPWRLAQCARRRDRALTDFDTGDLAARLTVITDKHPKLAKAAQRAPRHLGTLGTGNHFIELCLDEEDAVWVMLHSGSRGIGNAIGQYFIEQAKEDMKRWFINLPDQDLAYLAGGRRELRRLCRGGGVGAELRAARTARSMMARDDARASVRARTARSHGARSR